jgi:hypothetical protein
MSETDSEDRRWEVNLRHYFDQRLRDLDQRLTEQRDDLKDRLAGMNEFREALKDQSNQMATRDQLDQLRERLTETRLHVATVAGTVSIVVSIVVSIAAYLLNAP